jgi:hypothetical protein
LDVDDVVGRGGLSHTFRDRLVDVLVSVVITRVATDGEGIDSWYELIVSLLNPVEL